MPENNERAIAASLVDPLTGAFNRRYLETHVPRLFAQCRSALKPPAVLVIDIDRFRGINSAYGHHAGDHVLEEIVSRAISHCARRIWSRGWATNLRSGCRKRISTRALQIAERLRGRIGDTLVEGAHSAPPFTVTVSIGVAVA